jgi:hypothetical protein
MRARIAATAAVTLALAGCTSSPPEGTPDAPPATSATSASGTEMVVSRASHTATLLPDGRVLVAGGCAADGCEDAERAIRAEFYDPARARFVEGPAMSTPRVSHTATALADGRVLLVGGWPGEGRLPLATAEVFDPATSAFGATAAPMAARRGGHTATRLRDGSVLIVGGTSGSVALNSVELYSPVQRAFRTVAPLPAPRATHGAALLADGRVLVVGGQSGVGHGNSLVDTAVVYDPRRDAWQEVGRLSVPKYKLAVAPLPDGGALVIGGQTADEAGARLDTTELFDTRTGRFSSGPTMAERRYKISDAVALLADGRIAVGGGYGLETYADGRFTTAGTGSYERQFPAVVALRDGAVLVTGGYDDRTRVTGTAFLAKP